MSTKADAEAHINNADQKDTTTDEHPPKFEAGQEHAHDLHDPKDNLSLGNRSKLEKKLEKEEEEEANKVVRPTDIAKSHGNEPSRGAKIDEEIQKEEEELIKKMDEAKEQSKKA